MTTPDWFLETPESLAALAEERAALAKVVWERCTGSCGREYRYPYLCRKHMLCGDCHEGVPL